MVATIYLFKQTPGSVSATEGSSKHEMAERAGFEPAVSCPTLVFKTSTINHSVTSPANLLYQRLATLDRLPRYYRYRHLFDSAIQQRFGSIMQCRSSSVNIIDQQTASSL